MYRHCAIAALSSVLATAAQSDPCEAYSYERSPAPHLRAGSVPNDQLDDHLNSSKFTHGIQFSIEQNEGDLLVDITEYPRETQLAAGLFMVLQIGRLAQDDFERLVLVDKGIELFYFDSEAARRNGCLAVWGVSTAGSPLPLFVDIMGAAKDPKGNALVAQYSGKWLSDMNIALEAFNGVIAPEWMFSAAK